MTWSRTLAGLLAWAAGSLAAPPPANAPPFKLLRYDEDYSYLTDPARRSGFLDSLKYISLRSGSEDFYLSLGGEIRQRYEYFDNAVWGQGTQDNSGYLLQRYMLHADLHLGHRWRFFGQLKSGIATGREGGPRPADEDRLDLNQAFLEARLTNAKASPVLRVGRQEFAFGSSRLVAPREGPNVRQSFDGVRLSWLHSGWSLDALASRPVETNRDIFDDSPDHRRALWGMYASRPGLDLYYLGLDRKSARFTMGTGRELRHSLGLRLWGDRNGWDYNYETVYQFGSFGAGRIRAWTAASDTGYQFERVRFRPRFGIRADISSGDSDPSDNVLGTFNALFPRGSYFSEADLLGP